jgi:uncharacterized protein (TIGR03435 family)
VPLRYPTTVAFGVPPARIAGPGWLRTEFYDIEAKLPPGTGREQAKEMLRNLLVERFRLTYHWEMKEMPIYVMSVGEHGSKLQPTQPDPPPAAGSRPGLGKDGFPQTLPEYDGVPLIPSMLGKTKLAARNLSAPELALLLSGELDRPIVDATGLTGV